MNAGVFIRSLLHLKPSMIYWRIHRTLKGAWLSLLEKSWLAAVVFAPPKPPDHKHIPQLSSIYHCEKIDCENGTFTFLNHTVELRGNKEDRVALVARQPLLWQFHYAYHDYLIALLTADSTNKRLQEYILRYMRQWLEDNPLHAHGARRSAWHAYVLSIRIESWIRLSAVFPKEQFIPQHVLQMTKVLRRNMEFGTMANHLMKNIKALVLAGLYFNDNFGQRVLKQGLSLLRNELQEQVLADGMHFERSPMYHVAMTSDILDLYEALGESAPSILKSSAVAMTQFLERIIHPDGEVAFFNDSTSSFFLQTNEVLDRGMQMFGLHPAPITSEPGPINASKVSGYMCHDDGFFRLIFDGGNVGPDYQPGHAHCDTLSFELSLEDKRLITDTGVYHYKESPERTWSRCTAAHNTIAIDGVEQSEIWKSFRVGRRARILFAESVQSNGLHAFHAAHDGYLHLAKDLIHERFVVLSTAQRWISIIDMIHGSGTHRIESHLHFAPECMLQQEKYFITVALKGAFTARLQSAGLYSESLPPKLHITEYYPAFGTKQERPSITWAVERNLPAIGSYTLAFGDEIPQIECSANPLKFRILSSSGMLYESVSGLQ